MKIYVWLIALVLLMAVVVAVIAALADIPLVVHVFIALGVGLLGGIVAWVVPKITSRG